MVLGLLMISLIICAILQRFHLSPAREKGAKYGIILTICAYAACAREAARLIITLVVVTWRHILGMPLTAGQDIKLSIADFLTAPVDHRLFRLAIDMDVLMLGFIALATFLIWKMFPSLELRRAIGVTTTSWLIYIGLTVMWG